MTGVQTCALPIFTGYAIYRSTSSGAETLLTTVGLVTSYTDPSLTNGTTYYYQVAARNAIGEGSRSAEASAKPATVPGTLPVDAPGVQGSWVANYGADGYVLANWTGSADLVGLPAGRTVTVEQASRYSWVAPTSDVRALQSPDGSERRARTWYDGSEIRIRLDFASAYSGTLHLYALDWDSYGPRGETVTVDDGQGPRSASLAANSFVAGAWVHAPISVAAGHSVLITVDRTAGGNAVLGGLFLGGPAGTPPPPGVPGTPTALTAGPGNGQVTLAWSAPASDGGSPITGYAIYRSTSRDRKSVVSGKSVDLGCRRIIKKKRPHGRRGRARQHRRAARGLRSAG